jgi:hypothetical protein
MTLTPDKTYPEGGILHKESGPQRTTGNTRDRLTFLRALHGKAVQATQVNTMQRDGACQKTMFTTIFFIVFDF